MNGIDGLTKEEFNSLEEKQDSVARRLEIIGEATKNIPNTLKEQYPDIPWKRMAGLRDVLIHQYDDVDYDIIWKTATQFLPPLKQQIESILTERSD